MTLPEEEYNSLNATRKFLYELLNPKDTPGVPKYIRETAKRLSKHYPLNFSLDDRYPEVKKNHDSIITNYEHGKGWGKGKDE